MQKRSHPGQTTLGIALEFLGRALEHRSEAPALLAIGDKVNEGTAILMLESDSLATAPAAPPSQPSPVKVEGTVDHKCDLVVLGAGPGGYSAAFRAADLGLKVVLVERYPTLGGVCLNVGCIPSKALLHVAAVMDEVTHFADLGITFEKPKIDLPKLLSHKNKVVGKLTGGLAAMAKMRKVTVVQGSGAFVDPFHLQVASADGKTQTIRFNQAIIAAGSEAMKLPFLPKDDPRVVTSTGALELRQSPKRMLVVGGGIIGLEMGTVYSTLGARLDVVEMLDTLMTGADRDLVKVWQKMNAKRFDHIMLKTKTVGASMVETCSSERLRSFRSSTSPMVAPVLGTLRASTCTTTIRLGSGYGSGRQSTARIKLNIVRLAPMPSTSVATTTAANVGDRDSERHAYRTS